MGYYTDTYANEIRPVLLDWLTNTARGKNVTDLALSLANRAQHNLWEERPWSDLTTDATLTLTNNSCSLPADFGRIVDMWGDLSGTGVPMYWYYAADNYEKGYKLRNSFTLSTGHAWTITFYWAQTLAPRLRYQRVLEDFTGTGTEYSYFPANILLLECQKINTLEKGNIKEWQAFEAAYNDAVKRYSNAHQWVNADPMPRLNDRLGHEMMMEGYTLDGSGVTPYSPLPNSYIL